MKLSLCKIFLFLCNYTLYAAPVITVISPLNFPEKSAQVSESLVVATTDSGAALLRVTGGTPNATASCAMGKNSVTIITPPGANNTQKVTVNSFTIDCPGQFDAFGNMDVRIGATAQKQSADVAGDYTENTQTLKITY